jgi:hypothetical protein
MQGNLRKQSTNSWILQFYLGQDPATDKKRNKSATVKGTKREAERNRSEIAHQFNSGSFIQPTRQTFRDWTLQ